MIHTQVNLFKEHATCWSYIKIKNANLVNKSKRNQLFS